MVRNRRFIIGIISFAGAVLALGGWLLYSQYILPKPQPAPGLEYWVVKRTLDEEVMSERLVIRAMVVPAASSASSQQDSAPTSSLDTLPSSDLIYNTALNIWQAERKGCKQGIVYLYLPDMNPQHIAYGVSIFGRKGLEDFHLNEKALYGTKWYDIWQAKLQGKQTQPAEEVAAESHPQITPVVIIDVDGEEDF